MSAYISTQVTDAYLTELKPTNVFVRKFKQVTNNYTRFLESELYTTLQDVYNMDEAMIEIMYNDMKTEVEQATVNFLEKLSSIK